MPRLRLKMHQTVDLFHLSGGRPSLDPPAGATGLLCSAMISSINHPRIIIWILNGGKSRQPPGLGLVMALIQDEHAKHEMLKNQTRNSKKNSTKSTQNKGKENKNKGKRLVTKCSCQSAFLANKRKILLLAHPVHSPRQIQPRILPPEPGGSRDAHQCASLHLQLHLPFPAGG